MVKIEIIFQKSIRGGEGSIEFYESFQMDYRLGIST